MANDSTVYALLETYAKVGTSSLERHRHTFPFQQIFDAVESRSVRRCARVWFKGEDAVSPWCICYNAGSLKVSEMPVCENEGIWNVELSHLKNVQSNPEAFEENITLLDISWLTGSQSY